MRKLFGLVILLSLMGINPARAVEDDGRQDCVIDQPRSEDTNLWPGPSSQSEVRDEDQQAVSHDVTASFSSVYTVPDSATSPTLSSSTQCNTDGGGTTTSSLAAASSTEEEAGTKKCASALWVITRKNALDWWLYRMYHRAHFCWKNGNLVKVSANHKVVWDAWGITAWWANWGYVGKVADIRGGVWPDYRWRKFTGQFKFCLSGICTREYPWIRITVRPGGLQNVTATNGWA